MPPTMSLFISTNAPEGEATWHDSIQPRLMEMVKNSLVCVQDMVETRPHSFEIYGYDFMIDDANNPWLIEQVVSEEPPLAC